MLAEVARTTYGACASDGRSAGAWTERAAILRGTEGGVNYRIHVNPIWLVVVRSTIAIFTLFFGFSLGTFYIYLQRYNVTTTTTTTPTAPGLEGEPPHLS